VPASDWPYLDQPGILAFAHRGGAGDLPENTMPAFARAAALGYRYFETDAQLTADGVVVAFHDDVLDRVSDASGVIGEMTWSELAQVRVSGHPIPRMDELLETFPNVRINIDPKHDPVVDPLADLLLAMDAVERVGIGSFSDRRLAAMRRRCGPKLCSSLGPRGTARLKAAARGLPVGRLPAPCAQVPVRARGVVVTDKRLVEAAHRRGLQVHVWTVDEPEEMEYLLDLGVDGIMTDRLEVLKDVLTNRGLW
jgi:glycerophosphoryl diester phosphodiesterase